MPLLRPAYFLRVCWVQGTGQPREKPQRIETRALPPDAYELGDRHHIERIPRAPWLAAELSGESTQVELAREDSLAYGKVIEHLLYARSCVQYFINTISLNPDKYDY